MYHRRRMAFLSVVCELEYEAPSALAMLGQGPFAHRRLLLSKAERWLPLGPPTAAEVSVALTLPPALPALLLALLLALRLVLLLVLLLERLVLLQVLLLGLRAPEPVAPL